LFCFESKDAIFQTVKIRQPFMIIFFVVHNFINALIAALLLLLLLTFL
jgi:hypothetical protein